MAGSMAGSMAGLMPVLPTELVDVTPSFCPQTLRGEERVAAQPDDSVICVTHDNPLTSAPTIKVFNGGMHLTQERKWLCEPSVSNMVT